MNYKGRNVDVLGLWDKYVEFPPGIDADKSMFLPLVQCPNPEHDTGKRHFQINTSEPLVHCFAHCGISGTYAHAVALVEGYYDEAKVDLHEIDRIRQRAVKDRSREEHAKMARYYRAQRKADKLILRSSTGPKFPRKLRVQKNQQPKLHHPQVNLQYDSYLPSYGLEYLERRGITGDSIAQWELGWEPEEKRIVIPAKDENGVLRFLIRRAVKDSHWPKYLYSEGYPKTSLLFGACGIDLGLVQSQGLILVEGSLDTIKLHQYGLACTGAILGTGISREQMRIVMKLRPQRIFLMFDRDLAGVTNISLAVKSLGRKYPLFVCRYPKGKYDPAELTKKEAWNSLMRAVPYSIWDRKRKLRRPESSPTERNYVGKD